LSDAGGGAGYLASGRPSALLGVSMAANNDNAEQNTEAASVVPKRGRPRGPSRLFLLPDAVAVSVLDRLRRGASVASVHRELQLIRWGVSRRSLQFTLGPIKSILANQGLHDTIHDTAQQLIADLRRKHGRAFALAIIAKAFEVAFRQPARNRRGGSTT